MEDAQKEAIQWKVEAREREEAELNAYLSKRENQDSIVETMEQKQANARREYERALMEENKRLAAYRQQLRMEEEERERELGYASLPIHRHSLF